MLYPASNEKLMSETKDLQTQLSTARASLTACETAAECNTELSKCRQSLTELDEQL